MFRESMVVNNIFFREKLSVLFYVSAAFFSDLGVLCGSVEPTNTSVIAEEVSDSESEDATTSRWAINNGNNGLSEVPCPQSCVERSILMAAAMACEPEKETVYIKESEVVNQYTQYIEIFGKCIPLMESVVSSSLRIDATLVARFIGTTWGDLYGARGKGDFEFLGEELNEDFMDEIGENSENLKFFKQLVRMYYGIREREFDLQDFIESTDCFIDLRRQLFCIWLNVSFNAMMDERNGWEQSKDPSIRKKYKESEWKRQKVYTDFTHTYFSGDHFDRESFLRDYGQQVPGDLDYDDLAAFVIQNSTQEYCSALFGEYVLDRKAQEAAVDTYFEKLTLMQLPTLNPSIFLLGMTESSYWEGMLHENFVLNVFYTKSVECQEMYLLKSFFLPQDGEQKRQLDIVSCSGTQEINGHAMALTPDNRIRWVIGEFDVETDVGAFQAGLQNIATLTEKLEKLRKGIESAKASQVEKLSRNLKALKENIQLAMQQQSNRKGAPLSMAYVPCAMEVVSPNSVLSNTRSDRYGWYVWGEEYPDGFRRGCHFEVFTKLSMHDIEQNIGQVVLSALIQNIGQNCELDVLQCVVNGVIDEIREYTVRVLAPILNNPFLKCLKLDRNFYGFLWNQAISRVGINEVLRVIEQILPSALQDTIAQLLPDVHQDVIQNLIEKLEQNIKYKEFGRLYLMRTPYHSLLDECEVLEGEVKSLSNAKGK